ncbi:MAG: multidrug ABC transporter ATP-binding protein [Acidobacteria bacterium]|nr:MAG: multidrug ABC transporter ATP-binding protein [Acidobacteriota bacterium]PYQ67519.1 MAG: multidrug ABC transporter ATP-binding protein [Acidobacteriota bacterium]
MTVSPIQAEKLTRKFGDTIADDAVTFEVRQGEIYGLLGPNGAGKTTLVRMLTTLLHPTSGTARVAGHDVVREKGDVRASIGTVSQAETTDENLTVRENLSVQGKMYGLWGRDLSQRIERRLTQVGLWEKKNQLTKTLSGGMRRRLEIARGVLHSPHILFLDEPTTGLDPQSRRAVWEMLGELKSRDASLAIVLTTHAMDEANYLCDRVAIMDRGRILCEDAPEALKRSLPTGEHVEIETDREIETRDKESIVALGAVNWRSPSRTSVQFEARPGEGIGRRAAQLVEERGYEIRHLSISPVTLEDVFFAYTGRALREETVG